VSVCIWWMSDVLLYTLVRVHYCTWLCLCACVYVGAWYYMRVYIRVGVPWYVMRVYVLVMWYMEVCIARYSLVCEYATTCAGV